jgi:hypothetical protein
LGPPGSSPSSPLHPLRQHTYHHLRQHVRIRLGMVSSGGEGKGGGNAAIILL